MKFILFIITIVLTFSCAQPVVKADKNVTVVLEVPGGNFEFEQAKRALKERFDALNQDVFIKDGDRNRLHIAMNTVMDVQTVLNYATTPGQVDFYLCYKKWEALSVLKKLEKMQDINIEKFLAARQIMDMPEIVVASKEDSLALTSLLNKPTTKAQLLEIDPEIRFMWKKANNANEMDSLIAVKVKNDTSAMNGSSIEKASVFYSNTGEPLIDITLDASGTKVWGELTTVAFQENVAIAIAIDDVVYSAPIVAMPILGGRLQIAGSLSNEEVTNFVRIIDLPAIPKLNLLRHEVEALK